MSISFFHGRFCEEQWGHYLYLKPFSFGCYPKAQSFIHVLFLFLYTLKGMHWIFEHKMFLVLPGPHFSHHTCTWTRMSVSKGILCPCMEWSNALMIQVPEWWSLVMLIVLKFAFSHSLGPPALFLFLVMVFGHVDQHIPCMKFHLYLLISQKCFMYYMCHFSDLDQIKAKQFHDINV